MTGGPTAAFAVAVAGAYCLDRTTDTRRIVDVEADGAHAGGGERLQRFGAARGGVDHPAAAQELVGEGGTDAAGAAGDQNDACHYVIP